MPTDAARFRRAFGDFEGRVWLNCAHQGPLPLPAADAARQAIEWKLSPRQLTTERFTGVPARLRALLGQLIGASADEIILANGASYGLHLLANGLALEAGDDVLLMAGDFPSDILPWLALRERGVRVRVETPRREVFSADEISALVGPGTRLVCLPWVHSFSGYVTDLEAVGTLCRERGARFVVNTTQGLGARSLDVSRLPIDAVCNAGWKWLCGPYATGFCWMRPELRDSLIANQAYWQSTLTADDLGRADLEPVPPARDNPRRYDLFAPANFFNFVPWAASLELLLSFETARIEARDQELVERLLTGLDRDRFGVTSPEAPGERSTLVFLRPRRGASSEALHGRLAEAGIDVALRKGALRLSPHLYNTPEEIDRALEALHGAGDRVAVLPARGPAFAGRAPVASPGGETLEGRFVRLRPIRPAEDAAALWEASHRPSALGLWTYLHAGPFDSEADMRRHLEEVASGGAQHPLTVEHLASGRAAGGVSFMRVREPMRTLELGSIWYLPEFQRTEVNTESIYLMLRESFDRLGYRRVEWKCDSLNEPSRRAAIRLGFRFEGIFRQHMIIKGHSRDTAWYAMLDHEWPDVRAALERWLYGPERPRPSLSVLNRLPGHFDPGTTLGGPSA
jgi:selenocysteine lyase/cysteine desulfurase/RimJ/RimL family protein N-acetyltransferase